MFGEAEKLGDSVTLSWNTDKSVALFTLDNSKREVVDAYIEGNLQILRTWDKAKTLYTVQDISSGQVALTPYLKARLNEITDYVKTNQINVTTAIVMKNNFTGQVMRAFGRLFTRNAHYLKQVYFIDMSQAQEWVKKQQSKT